ncbi:MAG TPA: lipid-A-disaccharide synthase [Pseudolabrys sp.]|jgi:lipid-A-disaccharide synthase|nr:lipid-A-disaccharide synthase [Pseudolabrys sp.]
MNAAAGIRPHIFVVAGEESGDRLGAALMRSLKQRTNNLVAFSGVGGRHMAEEGLSTLFPIDELAIMGFAAIPASLPKIFQRIRQTADAVIATRPDVLVIIDSPDFTHRVARRVRRVAPEIPIVDYVCPSVWAWRPGRARAMRAYVDHVMALLPFEPSVLLKLGGPPGTYVGHPLGERVHDLRPNGDEALRRKSNPPIVLVLPGSRAGEIRRMQSTFGDALARVRAQIGDMQVIVPAVPHLVAMMEAAVAGWRFPARVVANPAEKDEAFRTARLALTKSGTSTLELAIAGIPMVAAYKVSSLEAMVARLMIKVPSVILANLVLSENVVPEFLQGDCTGARLAGALLPLFSDSPERRRQLAAFARLDAIMEIGTASASARAAEIVLKTAENVRSAAPGVAPRSGQA